MKAIPQSSPCWTCPKRVGCETWESAPSAMPDRALSIDDAHKFALCLKSGEDAGAALRYLRREIADALGLTRLYAALKRILRTEE